VRNRGVVRVVETSIGWVRENEVKGVQIGKGAGECVGEKKRVGKVRRRKKGDRGREC